MSGHVFAHAVNRHQYPQWLARPFMLRAWHTLTLLITLRNWYIGRWLLQHLPETGQAKNAETPLFTGEGGWGETRSYTASLLDVGCAAGDFFLPWARRHSDWACTGIDAGADAISLCRRFIEQTQLRNACAEHATLQQFTTPLQYDAVWCFSVLQYIDDDDAALRKVYTLLKPGGTLLLYVPVNERRLLPFYTRAMRALTTTNAAIDYDRAQGRMHTYTPNSIIQKLSSAGFTVTAQQGAHGLWGKLYYEPYSLLLQSAKALPVWAAWLPLVLLALLLPALWLLMWLDYLLPPTPAAGNGLLVMATR